jgi:hypothetical protein
MRKSLIVCALYTALLLAALRAGSAEEPLPQGRDFGAGLTLARTTPLADVVAAPERYAEGAVLLRGRLTDVCTKKGCWTVLADGDTNVRVRFQDYGFFLPPEALGAQALVEGVAETRTLSEREARHIAAESREGDPASVSGPQREIGFVATGVRLLSGGPVSGGPE